jgi:hypothetical protein
MGRPHDDKAAVAQQGIAPPLEWLRREAESNYQVFLRLRDGLTGHEGKYALMRSGMVIDYFSSASSALMAGDERFFDRVFSIHRVRTPQAARPYRSGGFASKS